MEQNEIEKQINDFEKSNYKMLLSAMDKVALISVTNAKGDIIYVNDKFVTSSKYSKEELLGQNHKILKSEQQPENMFEELWKTISSGKIWRGEIKNKTKDGTYFWVDSSISPVLDTSRKPEQYVAVSFLISDRKVKDQLFSAMLTVLEKNDALISETDITGNITYANSKFVEVSKYTLDELIGHNHRVLKSGQQPQEMFDELWANISDGKKWRGEIKNRAKDGSFYWLDTSIAPVLNQNGLPERYVAVHFVITARKLAEEELSNQNEAMLRVMNDLDAEKRKLQQGKAKDDAMLESIGDGVIFVDTNGQIVLVNQMGKLLLGYENNDMEGKMVSELVEIEDEKGQAIEESQRPITRTLTEKRKQIGTYFYIRKNGDKFPASVIVSPVLIDDQVVGAIEVFKDITHEREVDQMKTEFISLASHQLRTPLSAIRWICEMLLGGDVGELTSAQNEYVNDVSNANLRMIALVNALLNISRIESGRIIIDPELSDIRTLLQSVIDDVKIKIEAKKQTFVVNIADDIPQIMLDRKLIHEVFMNLLTNASKYSKDGGEITVLISKRENELVCQVADNGYGIPDAEKLKVFSKFFRGTNILQIETDGTGLGLYLTKAIVESSGGTIWFTSKENNGSTFWFTLPINGVPAQHGVVNLDT